MPVAPFADYPILLNTIFGHPAFRGAQEDIVSHVAAGGDASLFSCVRGYGDAAGADPSWAAPTDSQRAGGLARSVAV